MESLLQKLKTDADSIQFNEVMDVIAKHYDYTPCRFYNGLDDAKLCNEAGTNEGSCKLFAFAQLQQLSEAETLALFGDYYRVDVLQHPEGSDHGNIRNFIRFGWQGISFEGNPLSPKN